MSIPGCKKFPVDEKIETFQKLPVKMRRLQKRLRSLRPKASF
ncbi:hypothetical protein MmTuc01_2959 [Methanosarcina mazei Tuc01]|uniref:Uncharacterized protein n=1 Tax=Methanosarcina mazei Tuc01 TaxID=1236903 RepID=M1Q0Y0_METMZ|nr:hypothetical protein MmTuc01_2959 [Methanosarcina mazei Tuc01]